MTFTLANIRCACGAEPTLIDPGEPEVRAPGGILIERGRDPIGTCLRCWPVVWGTQFDLFGAQA